MKNRKKDRGKRKNEYFTGRRFVETDELLDKKV